MEVDQPSLRDFIILILTSVLLPSVVFFPSDGYPRHKYQSEQLLYLIGERDTVSIVVSTLRRVIRLLLIERLQGEKYHGFSQLLFLSWKDEC